MGLCDLRAWACRFGFRVLHKGTALVLDRVARYCTDANRQNITHMRPS